MIDEESQYFVLDLSAWDRAMESPVASRTERPIWETIAKAIEHAFANGGFAKLRVATPDSAYVHTLNMSSLPGKYRIEALTRDKDSKKEYLEWWEPGDSPFRGIEILHDDECDARTFCTDINVALKMFREMYEHGDLSEETLVDMRSPWNPKP